MNFWHEIGNESPRPDVSLRLQLRREISKISFKKGLKSPEIRHFGTNAPISLASSLDLPPACGLHLLHNCLGNYHISERTGEGGGGGEGGLHLSTWNSHKSIVLSPVTSSLEKISRTSFSSTSSSQTESRYSIISLMLIKPLLSLSMALKSS